jgi:hypothetical protein
VVWAEQSTQDSILPGRTLASPNRCAHCDNLTEEVVLSGHWRAQEKPVNEKGADEMARDAVSGAVSEDLRPRTRVSSVDLKAMRDDE